MIGYRTCSERVIPKKVVVVLSAGRPVVNSDPQQRNT